MLLILALIYLVYVERTRVSSRTRLGMSLTLLTGILLQSGGFFAHMLVGDEGSASIGTWMTRSGAVLLAIALVSLGVGLLRSRKADLA